jgi:ring-1,2-phenylacetyl-CoA epoxidase subunit PaaA
VSDESVTLQDVKSPEDLHSRPAEYRQAVAKIVISHALNELHGATVFDEPAIALAPTPYWKWLSCRVAMEEYGHHVRFFELGRSIGIPQTAMLPDASQKRTLSIFDFPMRTWTEFCVIKLLADLAEVLQVEDLLKCSFLPLRNTARMTMPEERFHAKFGEDACTELIERNAGRARVQDAIDRIFPTLPAFFGGDRSTNNAIFRKWRIKERTNEEMRADYVARAGALVGKLGLVLPQGPAAG